LQRRNVARKVSAFSGDGKSFMAATSFTSQI
jgi:hypothetical protein